MKSSKAPLAVACGFVLFALATTAEVASAGPALCNRKMCVEGQCVANNTEFRTNCTNAGACIHTPCDE